MTLHTIVVDDLSDTLTLHVVSEDRIHHHSILSFEVHCSDCHTVDRYSSRDAAETAEHCCPDPTRREASGLWGPG